MFERIIFQLSEFRRMRSCMQWGELLTGLPNGLIYLNFRVVFFMEKTIILRRQRTLLNKKDCVNVRCPSGFRWSVALGSLQVVVVVIISSSHLYNRMWRAVSASLEGFIPRTSVFLHHQNILLVN